MKRSILFSLLAIGVAVTVLAVAGTQALFSDQQTASGDIDAGTISLHLDEDAGGDDNGDNEFVFELGEGLLPGGTASETLRLTNNGTATWKIGSITPVITLDAECDAGNLGDEWSVAISGAGLAVGTVVAPTLSTSGTIDVTLAAAAGNPCQGDIVTVTVTVDVVQP